MIAMKNVKSLIGCIVVLTLVAVPLTYYWFTWWPEQAWIAFENYHLDIMENMNSQDSKANVTSWFQRNYNFTELYDWVHGRLEFIPINETFERHTDPVKIYESGKGRCGEFSILYAAACLAHGYQTRIVVAVDTSNPRNLYVPHGWAEVKLDGWVHVDPSDNRWNEPHMYENREWGKDIGSTVKIYAFEEAKYEDVTSKYAQKTNAGDVLNFLNLSEIFLVTFSILYGIMLNSCIGLELFPFGRLGTCCKKISRRIAKSIVIINLVPIIFFSLVLYALDATSPPLNIITVIGTFFLAMSVFGFYRLMIMVIV